MDFLTQTSVNQPQTCGLSQLFRQIACSPWIEIIGPATSQSSWAPYGGIRRLSLSRADVVTACLLPDGTSGREMQSQLPWKRTMAWKAGDSVEINVRICSFVPSFKKKWMCLDGIWNDEASRLATHTHRHTHTRTHTHTLTYAHIHPWPVSHLCSPREITQVIND